MKKSLLTQMRFQLSSDLSRICITYYNISVVKIIHKLSFGFILENPKSIKFYCKKKFSHHTEGVLLV